MTGTSVDLVMHGGLILTAVHPRLDTTALAVLDGRVVATGDQALALVGSAREVVDLEGRVAVPGFHDAHAHPVFAGLDMLGCHLRDCEGPTEYAPRMRDWADEHPGDGWIVATGWHTDHFPPERRPVAAILDDVSSSRPILFWNSDAHSVWLNTAGLRDAGITEATPDPDQGRIERDHAGRPTGVLHDAAMELAARLVPPPTPELLLEGLLTAQTHLHSLGVTGWQDAAVGPAFGHPNVEVAYLRAVEAGLLTARVTGAMFWDAERGVEQVDDLVARRRATARPGYHPEHVKFLVDGVPESGTSALLEPYCCAGPDGEDFGNGPTYYEPAFLQEVVSRLDAAGFGVHFHALGDRSLRDALDAVEAARRANGLSPGRHQIAHVYLATDTDLDRFASLGVIANLQLFWGGGGELSQQVAPYLGVGRAERQFPYRTVLDHGAPVAAGSDWPVTSPDPWACMHVAVNRQRPGMPNDPHLPHEAISPGEALHAYTRGSALANGDDQGGLLVTGARADIAVLDRNPLDGPKTRLAETQNVATYVRGRRVYAS